MKNLFKTLITVLTVVCMLSSMTAFAASQATVTTYNSDTSVNVATTVSGVAADVIVTYLVANDANENGVADADEIKYINQATSTGAAIPFNYAITGEGWSAGNTIAAVQFGSNDADTASALNDDSVLYDEIPFSVNIAGGAEISYEKIGKGDVYTDVVIKALPGYTLTALKIGDVDQDTTVGTYTVAYGQAVSATVEAITDTTVYLFEDATVADGYEIYDQNDNKLNVVTGIGYYVGGPVDSAAIEFDGIDIDGAHENYTYEATVGSEASGYFAVQLAQAEAFAEGAKATNAIVVKGENTVEAK